MLLPFFEWLEATPVGHALAQSIWSFSVIEALHLVTLCLLGGSLLLVDLRLLGLGVTGRPISEVGDVAHRWMVWATVAMIATGTLLLISEPIKLYWNQSFWVKMWSLPVAIAFTLTVRRRVVGSATDATWRTRLVALVSIGLWLTVAAAGRWIGFSS